MKRDELSSRIWRTVVFSGAMLGTPLASADNPPQGKPAPVRPAPDTLESVTKLLDVNMEALLAAIDALAASPKETVNVTRVVELRNGRAALEVRLAKLPKPPPPAPSVAKLQKQLADHDAKLLSTIDSIADSKDPLAVVNKLAEQRKQRGPIAANLKAEIAKQKRPRTPDEDRPVGRGFILG